MPHSQKAWDGNSERHNEHKLEKKNTMSQSHLGVESEAYPECGPGDVITKDLGRVGFLLEVLSEPVDSTQQPPLGLAQQIDCVLIRCGISQWQHIGGCVCVCQVALGQFVSRVRQA